MMMGALAFSTVLAVICAIYAPSPATDIPAHSGFVATVSLLKMYVRMHNYPISEFFRHKQQFFGRLNTCCLFCRFISVVFTVIYVYTAELYSSAERGTAIGAGFVISVQNACAEVLCNFPASPKVRFLLVYRRSAASRVGGIFTPFISTALHHVGAGIPFYLFSAASLFGLIALFILPIAPTSIR